MSVKKKKKKNYAGESASSIGPTEDYRVSYVLRTNVQSYTHWRTFTNLSVPCPFGLSRYFLLLFHFGTSRFDLDTFPPNTNTLNVSVTHAVVRSMATECCCCYCCCCCSCCCCCCCCLCYTRLSTTL